LAVVRAREALKDCFIEVFSVLALEVEGLAVGPVGVLELSELEVVIAGTAVVVIGALEAASAAFLA